jgi:hypothetical protein
MRDLEMRGHRVVGTFSVTLLALGMTIAALAQPVVAQSTCQLSVEPKAAVAGTTFQLHGSGFSPTQLIVRKDGDEATTIDLDLKGADPFDIPIGSKQGDEGTWHATVTLPGTCSASITFSVTLQPTDTVSDAVGALTREQDGHLPLGVYLLVIATGLVGGVVAASKLRLAR